MREPVGLRRKRILAVVHARGAVKVSSLAAELDVSAVTLRRDVEELARTGMLRRGHGVVRPMGDAVPVTAVPAARSGQPAGDEAPVALVVPERHSYLHETLHGARTALEEAGRRITLHIAPQAAGAERPQVERALAAGVSGLLIAPRWRSSAGEEADHGWLAEVGVPTVLMERRPRPGSVLHALDSVCSDHWYGIHLAVDHLVSLGHRRIVLAARNDSPTARSIRAAFADIAAARPEVEDWAVVLSSPDAGPGGPGTPEEVPDIAALLRERGMTGAVLHGDEEALMLVQRMTENGIRVPQDCSVVAYDDVVAALGSTALTAVAPPRTEIGRTAAQLLMHRLAQPPGTTGPVRRTELLPRLEVRGSTQVLHRPAK
ncbi:MAG TPA: substrate-binding domain-containing protein [Streptomyces sp.]|uniref:substrate-binding domain-containing protein n=1 Tax=Streptomyces sp. TaxID=1931 RepID=UPI002C9D102D|nr:substrate-binding domain-containing protein [Streptomyces sp.]HWU09272.1 substrate-binding domain-containing protein [Streptomyces sp.]